MSGRFLSVYAAFAVFSGSVSASVLFSSGTLTDFNQIVEEQFTLDIAANVTVSTLQPTNLSTPTADTTGSFAQGGFDPVVWLFSDETFNQATTQFGKNDDICIGTANPLAGCPGHVFDAQVTVALGPGTYVAVVSTAGDSSEPQVADGQHFFRLPDYQVAGWSYDGTFDFGSSPVEVRTGYYQLTISSDSGSTITAVAAGSGVVFPNHGSVTLAPEPGTAGLFLAAMILAIFGRRRSRA